MHGLFDYQKPIAYAAARRLAKRGTRAQVLMACGTGKTHVGMRVTEDVMKDNDAPLVALVFPNLSLLSQTFCVWRDHSTWNFEALAVCSDIVPDDRDGEVVEETFDEAMQGVDLHRTTNPRDIKAWVTNNADRPRVIFSTYQSSDDLGKAARALKRDKHRIDFLLADEAHRTTGVDVKDEAPSLFGYVVDDAKVPADRRLFMTATAKTIAGVRNAAAVRSMDSLADYGMPVGDYPFRKAIDDGNLIDYQVHVVHVAAEDVAHTTGRPLYQVKKDFQQSTESRRAHQDVAVAALVDAIGRRDLRSVMVFHNRVNDSKEFVKILNAVAHETGRGLEAYHVDAHMPVSQRAEVLNRMCAATKDPEAPVVVVSNVAVFTEGVDVPEMDAVMIADTRSSCIEVAQIVGRTLRLPSSEPRGSGKCHKPAVVLLPAIAFDTDDDARSAVTNGTAFADVWQTLKVMGEYDQALVEAINEAERGASSRRHRTARVAPAPTLGGDDGVTPLGTDPKEAVVEVVRDDVTIPGTWHVSGDGMATHHLGSDDSGVALVVPADLVPAELIAPRSDDIDQGTSGGRAGSRTTKRTLIHVQHGTARNRPVAPLAPVTVPRNAAQIMERLSRTFDRVATEVIYTGRNDAQIQFSEYVRFFRTLVRRWHNSKTVKGGITRKSPWPSMWAQGYEDSPKERSLARFLAEMLYDVSYRDIDHPEIDEAFGNPEFELDTDWKTGVSTQVTLDAKRLVDEVRDLTNAPVVDPDVPWTRIAADAWQNMMGKGAPKRRQYVEAA